MRLKWPFGVTVLLVLLLGAMVLWRFHVGAPLRIVHQKCKPAYLLSGDPAPCRAIKPAQGYALLQDKEKGLHTLLIPTVRIAGIESRILTRPETPNYFWLAWQARDVVSVAVGRSVPDTAVAITVDSRYASSHNQLHLRIACLRPQIRRQLALAGSRWNDQWSGYWLLGHRYYLRTLTEAELAGRGIFLRVAEELPETGQAMGRHGIALAKLQNGRFVLMVLPSHLLGRGANLGAPDELQDDACATASNASFPTSHYSRVLRRRERPLIDAARPVMIKRLHSSANGMRAVRSLQSGR